MVYFVTHPNLGTTALVQAPATEKARTTFLDYLERRNLIGRADRQYWRRNMVAEKMEYPEDVQADVELFYGYEEGGQRVPEGMAPLRGAPDAGAGYDRYVQEGTHEEAEPSFEDYAAMEEMGHPVGEEPTRRTLQEVSEEAPKRLSPIARAALRGYMK